MYVICVCRGSSCLIYVICVCRKNSCLIYIICCVICVYRGSSCLIYVICICRWSSCLIKLFVFVGELFSHLQVRYFVCGRAHVAFTLIVSVGGASVLFTLLMFVEELVLFTLFVFVEELMSCLRYLYL